MGSSSLGLFPSKGAVVFLLPVLIGLFSGIVVGLQVTVTPSVIRKFQGASIQIQCAVRNIESNAKLVPYWYHNFAPNMNRIVAVSTLTKYPYSERSSIAAYYYIGGLDYILHIRNLTAEDAGIYICSIQYQNGNRGTFQESATVTVLEPPSLPSCFPSGSVSIMEGSLLAMSCSSDAVVSPDDLSIQWQSTDNPYLVPSDSDWTVVPLEDQPIQKQLTVVASAGYNNGRFVCSAAREDDSLGVVVLEYCTIGPITIIPTSPEMAISVAVLHPPFPLQEGGAAHFACEVNLTQTPHVLGTNLETSWDISPKIDPVRVFHSSLPGGTSIVIRISHQDNGAVISCAVTYKGDTYRDNVTLVVSPISSTVPGLTTVASQSASAASNTYPTAATNAVLTEAPTTPQNQPWYSEPIVIIPIALSAAVLVFLVILVSCLIIRRRKRRRERKKEEAELQELSRYPPLTLHARPTSENLYHELSDQNQPPEEARETHESPIPGEEQPYSECTSPQPELEVYAETVENILYVPSVDEPTVVTGGAVGPVMVGDYEMATFGKVDEQEEGPYTYAAVM